MHVEQMGGMFCLCEESVPLIGGPRHGEYQGTWWSCLPPVRYTRNRIEDKGEFIAEVWAFDDLSDGEFFQKLCEWSDQNQASHAEPD